MDSFPVAVTLGAPPAESEARGGTGAGAPRPSARELAGTGILINAIAPGADTTEITNAVIAAGPERAGRDFYERNLKQKASGGDSPDLAARLAVHLASGRAGALTGKLLSAKWDQLEGLDAEAANRSSLYALRRVDEVLFREVRKP